MGGVPCCNFIVFEPPLAISSASGSHPPTDPSGSFNGSTVSGKDPSTEESTVSGKGPSTEEKLLVANYEEAWDCMINSGETTFVRGGHLANSNEDGEHPARAAFGALEADPSPPGTRPPPLGREDSDSLPSWLNSLPASSLS